MKVKVLFRQEGAVATAVVIVITIAIVVTEVVTVV